MRTPTHLHAGTTGDAGTATATLAAAPPSRGPGTTTLVATGDPEDAARAAIATVLRAFITRCHPRTPRTWR